MKDEPVCPHASRRIAAQRCWGGGVLVRAATLLSTRGEDARRIWRNEADGEHACLLHAKPTCGCRKRSPAPIHCFRPVIYNEWCNSNGNLARQRPPAPREGGRGGGGRRAGAGWGAARPPATLSSPGGLTRGSIFFVRTFLRTGWIAGSSPAMTTAIVARICPSPASPLSRL